MSGQNKGSFHYRGTSGGNPVINHQHNIQEEISDVSRWANQYLGVGGYPDHLITDLASDMADGITLLRLVQAVSDCSLPKHRANPMIRVHKRENIQICLNFLQQQGVQITGIHVDDIVGENKKAILSLCHALRRHYTAGPSPKTSRVGSKGQHKFNFSSLDKDDIAILTWVGKRVGRDIHDYTALYDGRVLCELMNEIEDGAIPQEVIFSGTAEQRLEQALATGQKNFFIGHGSLSVAEIAGGRADSRLKSYLQQCQMVYQQSAENRRGAKTSTTLTRPRRSARDSEREGVSHQHTPISSSLESREAAKIASRTYEGIQQRKLANGDVATTPHHSSHDNLPTKPQPHSSKRPLSDIYVSGASSYTDLSTTRSEHAEMVRKYAQQRHHPISKHSSSSAESLDQGLPPPAFNRHHSLDIPLLSNHGGSGSLPPGSSHWQRHSAGYESDSSTGSTLLRSHSQGSITADTAISGYAGGGGRRGERGREGGALSAALASRSLARSIDSVNTPTFDPPSRSGSGMGFRHAGSYSRLDSGSSAVIVDELSSHIDNLEERVGLLAMQFLYERHDMFKQIHTALVKERRKRQALERRTKELERLSKQAVKHYDARFIELASEVSKLRGELLSVGRGKSSTASSVTAEIGQLKDQVNKLMEQKNSAKSVGALMQFPKRSTKQSLFMRKRATSDLSDQSNPSVSTSTHRHGRQRGRSVQRPPSPTTRDLSSSSTTNTAAASVSQKPGPFLLGSATSFKKLSNFFGVEPPRVQNLKSFLDDLGYSELLPVFDGNGVGLAELSCMSESHLEQLGVPFGQHIRILKEIEQLQPLEVGTTKTTDVI